MTSTHLSYNIGPKLGDFINGLMIPRYLYEKTGKKAIIYISNEGCTFTNPIKQTFEELRPLILKQDFVKDFRIHRKEKCDYNLYTFRQSPNIFKKSWVEIYFNMFLPNEEIPIDYQWLYLPITMNNNILLNRSARPVSPSTREKYEELVDKYKIKFICSDISQFNQFFLSQKTELLHKPNLYNMCEEIAACELFIGNQSAPLAIASAFGKNRIIELRQNPDAPHYKQEEKYSTSLSTFTGD